MNASTFSPATADRRTEGSPPSSLRLRSIRDLASAGLLAVGGVLAVFVLLYALGVVF
ncbi:MAG: hypothetical protein ACYDEP_02815 [Acidimicrobiales bacterium]